MRFFLVLLFFQVGVAGLAQHLTPEQRSSFRDNLAEFAKSDLDGLMASLGFDRDGRPQDSAVDALIAEAIRRDLEETISAVWTKATGRDGKLEVVMGETAEGISPVERRLLFSTIDPLLAIELPIALNVPSEIVLVPTFRTKSREEQRTRILHFTIDVQPRSKEEIERRLPAGLSGFAAASPAVTEADLSLSEVEMERVGDENRWFLRTSKKQYAKGVRRRLFYSINFAIKVNPADPRSVTAYVRFEHWEVPNGGSVQNAKLRYHDEKTSMEQVASGTRAEDYRMVVPVVEMTGAIDQRPEADQSPYKVAGKLIEEDSSRISKMLKKEVERLADDAIDWIVER